MKFTTAGTLGGVIYLQILLVNGRPILFSTNGFAPLPENMLSRPEQHHFRDREGESTFQSKTTVIAPSSVVINHSEKVQPVPRSHIGDNHGQMILQRRSPSPGRISQKDLKALSAATEGGEPSWMHVDRRDMDQESGALVRRLLRQGAAVALSQQQQKAIARPKSFVEAVAGPNAKQKTTEASPPFIPTLPKEQVDKNVDKIAKDLWKTLKGGPEPGALLLTPWSNPARLTSQAKTAKTQVPNVVAKGGTTGYNAPKYKVNSVSTGYFAPKYNLVGDAPMIKTRDGASSQFGEVLLKRESSSSDKAALWQHERNDTLPSKETAEQVMMAKRGPGAEEKVKGEAEGSRRRRHKGPRRAVQGGASSSSSSPAAVDYAHVPVPLVYPHIVQPHHFFQHDSGYTEVQIEHPRLVYHPHPAAYANGAHDLTRSISVPHVAASPHNSTPSLQRSATQPHHQYTSPYYTTQHDLQSHPASTSLPSSSEVDTAMKKQPLSLVFSPKPLEPGAGMFYTD